MWVVKYLKSFVSEHLVTVSMLKSLETYTTGLPSNCFIPLAKIESESFGISGSEILQVFVKRLTADKPILFVRGTIYCNQFNCNYLRSKKYFLNFLLNI